MAPRQRAKRWQLAFTALFAAILPFFVLFGLGIGGAWTLLILLLLLGTTPCVLVKAVAVDRWANDSTKSPSLLATENRPGLTTACGLLVVIVGVFLLAPRDVSPYALAILQPGGFLVVLVGLGIVVWGRSMHTRATAPGP